MASFEEIDKARKLLELPDAASIREIEEAYRKMAFRYHPDVQDGDQRYNEIMKELNYAYKLLRDYCAQYRYSFGEEDVKRTYPEESFRRQYVDGWFQGP